MRKKKTRRERRESERKKNGDLRGCCCCRDFFLFHSLGVAMVLLRLNMLFSGFLGAGAGAWCRVFCYLDALSRFVFVSRG